MTIGGGLKSLLDGLSGLTAVFRLGESYDEAEFPYSTILDPLSDAPLLTGDSRTLATRRVAQVDLWQKRSSWEPSLVDDVFDALDGQVVEGGIRLRVTDAQEIPDDDPDIVHHAITVSTARLR